MSRAVETVRAWHEAVNAGDIGRLDSIVADEVEIGGPRGSGSGRAMHNEWIGRAGISLVPQRYWARGNEVVAEETARWAQANGELTPPITAFSAFRLTDDRITSIARFETLDDALAKAGLTDTDAVDQEGSGERESGTV